MNLYIISKEVTRNYKDVGAEEHICYLINGCKSKRLLRKD